MFHVTVIVTGTGAAGPRDYGGRVWGGKCGHMSRMAINLPLRRPGGDGPGADKYAGGAVGYDAEGAARVAFLGPRAGDRLGETRSISAVATSRPRARARSVVRPTAAISGSANTTRGFRRTWSGR
jgi:hypothetical protein